jgi:myosin heavy subunit
LRALTPCSFFSACSPHFVRCLKPNTSQEPYNFQTDFVLTQLRYTGVLETVRIRREGYSYRPTFAEFVNRFRILAFAPSAAVADSPDSCKRIVAAAGIKDFAMG